MENRIRHSVMLMFSDLHEGFKDLNFVYINIYLTLTLF